MKKKIHRVLRHLYCWKHSMENLESLQFELESLLYTKSEVELKEFAVSIKLDVDLSEKSKIAALKTIQKSIDERVVEEGELSE